MKKILFLATLLVTMTIQAATPSVYYLYRQSPDFNHTLVPNVGFNAVFPGACLSCSTQLFKFSQGFGQVRQAQLRIYWQPNSTANSLQLVKFDSGPTNIEIIGNVYSTGVRSATFGVVDITTEFNYLISQGVDKQIGWMVRGDPNDKPRFYVVKLEVIWE